MAATLHRTPFTTSRAQFVSLVEGTLIEHGLGRKVVPDEQTLQRSYREMVAIHRLNAAVQRVDGDVLTAEVPVPADLTRRVAQLLRKRPHLPWDRALSELAGRQAQTE